MAPDDAASAVVDVVFELGGTEVPADYAAPLCGEVRRHLPWFDLEDAAGLHPLRVMPTAYGVALLARRARLVLRVPEARAGDCCALEHAALELEGRMLHVGAARIRPLRPSPTLSAQRVAGAAHLGAFEDAAREELARLGIAGEVIAGRPREARAGTRRITGYALTVHGLGAGGSLRLQASGLGGERRLGWGIFVPAKTIEGLGADPD